MAITSSDPVDPDHHIITSTPATPMSSDKHDGNSEDVPDGEPVDLVDSEGNQISFRPVAPVDVKIRHLAVSIDVSPVGIASMLKSATGRQPDPDAVTSKRILNDVSADMPSGSLTAIVGGSGSGKTSMLNVMAGRIHGRRLGITGHTYYNRQGQISSVRTAYVMQQDVLLPTLTVRETLQYSADLRLPPPTTREERRIIVEEIILELGLKDCADTRIGNDIHKGCSGGENRRTSIGVQLLANPSVLFLDEPTTGLDATSAYQLMRTLKGLAKKGRTIISTIHQPRSEIWGLFDNLVILSQGSAVYSGPCQACVSHFDRLGYPLPPFVNPAEHVIDIAAVDNRSTELEKASKTRVEQLKSAWLETSSQRYEKDEDEAMTLAPQDGPSESMSAFRSALGRQIRVLTARTIKTTYRDPMGMAGSLLEAISMAIVTGWIFYHLDGSLGGIRSREGALFTAAALQGYLILLYETYRLTVDIELFDRERGEGVVGVTAFLTSRRLARCLIEDIPVPFLFSTIFYFMCGFSHEASKFFIFFAIVVLNQYIAVSFATLCVAASRSFAGATLIANMGYTLQSLAGGFYVQADSIPVWMRWSKWTAYNFYAFGAMCANEFIGNFYDCPLAGGRLNPACKEYDGDFVFASLAFPHNWIARPISVLVAFAVSFYLGAGLVLKFWKVEMEISRARTNDTDYSAGKEQMQARSREDERRTLNMTLDGFALDIDKRHILRGKMQHLEIVKPISARLNSGELNVIMGPSGSGKTTLLNAMAQRLQSTITTRYRFSGRLLLNGSEASRSVISSICSFVEQSDDALLPSLTVRETLHFAAGLRLPTWMSRAEKDRRAESVLMKLGLKDCANNLVGNELVKGISGGEKRRVTIAVQILTDPRVLLLDEPTSGLDAFTASSIIDVLQGLADEGRTIIMTIHQSRSDIFSRFGSILLLARGGFPVYAGPAASMLSHFSSLGHSCPAATNPADFALDLITVDLQALHKETLSRSRVSTLVGAWSSQPNPLSLHASHTSITSPASLNAYARQPTPFFFALPILLHRSVLNILRQPPLYSARIAQVLGLGVILTLFFAPLRHDYAAVQSRIGFIQEFTALYFVGMLHNVAVYPLDRDVFYREHRDRAYTVSAFFAQYTLLELPFEILTSIGFAALTVFAAGLPRSISVAGIVAFNAFCIVNCGESVGIVFNTLVPHTGFAVNVTSVVLSLATIMTGVLSVNLPAFLSAWNHLSPLKWSIGNLAPYTLHGLTFTCTAAERLPNGSCPIQTGADVLHLYKLERNANLYLMALAITTVVYRLVAFLLLKCIKSDWRSLVPSRASTKPS